MRCVYRSAVIDTGDIREVDIFPVFEARSGKAGAPKGHGRYKATSEVQARYNERRAERETVRMLNANFVPGDFRIDLTYTDSCLPDCDDVSKADIKNYTQRVKRLYKTLGADPKIYSVSPGAPRYHHHVIISGIPNLSDEKLEYIRKRYAKLMPYSERTDISLRDLLEAMWNRGRANCDRLQFDENGITGLGNYIFRNGNIFGKRYCATRNMVKPEVRTRDGLFSQREAMKIAAGEASPSYAYEVFEKKYPGYELVKFENQQVNGFNGGAYLTARLIRIGSDAWRRMVAMRYGRMPRAEREVLRHGE